MQTCKILFSSVTNMKTVIKVILELTKFKGLGGCGPGRANNKASNKQKQRVLEKIPGQLEASESLILVESSSLFGQ